MSGSSTDARLKEAFARSVAGNPRKKKRPPPVSIRLSEEERAALHEHAGTEALGPYIKRYVLDQHRVKSKRQRKKQTHQHETIARTLRRLGDSGIYNLLHRLIIAAEEERLFLDRDQENDLRRAASDVTAMRNDLVSALGLREEGGAL